MPRVQVWTPAELAEREEVFRALVAKALRLSARALTAEVSGLLTAAAAPGVEPEPAARSAAFALALGDLGTVQATWTARVDAELHPYLVQAFLESAADTRAAVGRATGRSLPSLTLAFARRALAELRDALVTLGSWLTEKLSAQLRAGYDAGDDARQLAGRVHAAAVDAAPVAENTAGDALAWAATLAELRQLQVAGFTDAEVDKQWLSSDDPRVRPAHAEADGQRVGLTRQFKVGGENLYAPRDPRGRADNVKNCRCALGYVFHDDADEPLTAHGGDKHNQRDHGRRGGKKKKKKVPAAPAAPVVPAPSGPISKESREALKSYSSLVGHISINTLLRDGPDAVYDWERDYAERNVKLIREALRPLPDRVTVYRGTSIKQFPVDTLDELKSLVGETVVDRGFSSTSTEMIGRFVPKDTDIMTTIDVPAGYLAASMTGISSYNEEELLLRDDTRFRITGVEPPTEKLPRWHVRMEVLP